RQQPAPGAGGADVCVRVAGQRAAAAMGAAICVLIRRAGGGVLDGAGELLPAQQRADALLSAVDDRALSPVADGDVLSAGDGEDEPAAVDLSDVRIGRSGRSDQ